MAKQQEGINIRYELIKALGTSDTLQEIIKQTFEKSSEEYYRYYRESGFYRDEGFSVYPIRYYRSLQMVTGIVEKCYATNNFLPLQSLLKRGYGKLYRYLTQNNRISYEKVLTYILNSRSMEDITETELLNNYVVTCYVVIKEGKMFDGLELVSSFIAEQNEIVNTSLYSYYREKVMQENGLENEIYDAEDEAFIQEAGEKIIFGKTDIDANNILDMYIENSVIDLYKENNMSSIQEAPHLYQSLRAMSFVKGGNASTVGFYSGLLKAFGFFEQMCLQPISEDKRKKFLYTFEVLFKRNNLPEEMRAVYAISGLFLLITTQEYRDLRDNYLREYEEETEYEHSKATEKLTHEIEALKKEKHDTEVKLSYEMEQKNALVDSLQEKLEAYERENKRLSSELAKKSENDNELIALRNYVFDEEVETPKDVTLDEMQQYVAKYTLIFIGGHENWVNKLKETFPRNEYLSVDEKGRSFEKIKRGNKVIVYNTATNSHTIYNRMIKNMHSTNKLLYINGNYNKEKTIQQIYHFLKELNK